MKTSLAPALPVKAIEDLSSLNQEKASDPSRSKRALQRIFAFLHRGLKRFMKALHPRHLWRHISFLSPIVLILGLVLGAIVHLASTLLIPILSQNSAYNRLMRVAAPYTTVLISSTTPLDDEPYTDPLMVRSACHFNLAQGPVRITLPVSTSIVQTLSIHGEKGGVYYAVSDRAAQQGLLSVLLLSQRDLDELQAMDEDDTIVRDVRLALPVQRGFVLTRGLIPFASLREKAEDDASQLSCAQTSLK
jgi:uncharacterized membrane protein